MGQLKKFDERAYKIGYARGDDGSETFFIVQSPPILPREEAEWSSAEIIHAYYFEDRLYLDRLEKLVDRIQEENEKYYENECYQNDSSVLSYPDLSTDLVIWDSQAPVIFRDHSYPITEACTAVVPLQTSDYARTKSLVSNELLKPSENIKTNMKGLGKLDLDNPDSRLIALTLASLHIGRSEYSFDDIQKSSETLRLVFQELDNRGKLLR